jgi:thioredoxin reductase (NADPH)
MHLHSLNWGAKSKLKKNGVTYANAKAILKDKNTVELKSANGSTIETAENIVIATGCRPSFGNIKGAKECCITSDDMFSRKKPFGDTLVVGGSYVALECAGVIRGFNKKVTIMSNGKILSNFDKDMALTVRSHLLHSGIAIKEGISPLEMSKTKDGKIQVLTKPLDMVTHTQEFDDVLLAIGRSPCTSNIGLENVGVQLAKDGKILTNSEEQTNVSNIYALGDVAYNRIMLTPVAGKAGRLLARRLYGKSIELMDYNLIPTALFTPVEYGSCGLTEEQAIEKNGTDITVYHTKFTPLEWHIDPEEERPPCHIKIICEKSTDRIIGFHIVSPNAGEITQGFAAAMKCGISKSVLDSTMGIHPTIAEDCIGILTTKENNANPVKGSC